MPPKELPQSRDIPVEDKDMTPEDIGKLDETERGALLVYGVLRIATALEDLVDSMQAASGIG